MKTLNCRSAWLGLLPLPLDQALRIPLQKNKSLIISRKWRNVTDTILRSLSKDVFERYTSTGSEAFYLFTRLDAIKFVLLTFFSLIKTIHPRVSTKPPSNDAKKPGFRLTSVVQKRCCFRTGIYKKLLNWYFWW